MKNFRKLLLLAAAAPLLAVSACGNAVDAAIVGQAGVTVSDDGSPVVVIAVCERAIDQVEISTGREGLQDDEPNPIVGTWDSKEPLTGLVELDLRKPSAEWREHKPVMLDANTRYIVTAWKKDADVEVSQVDFFLGSLRDVDATTVLTASGLVARDRFFSESCQERSYE